MNTDTKYAMAGEVGPLTAAALISAELSTPTSDAVNLLREIRAQDFLSDSMRARIDELLSTPAAVAQPKATSDAQGEAVRSFVSLVAAGPNAGCGCRPVCRCFEPESVVAWAESVREMAKNLDAAPAALSKHEDGVRVDDAMVERALIALSGHCIDCRPHWHESDREKMREVLEAAISMQDAGEGWVLVPRKAWESVEFVHGSFVKYEAQGPSSKNRQFAIRILGNAIESVDAMLAAAPSRPVARQPSGEEWQPIETAPKDGAVINNMTDEGPNYEHEEDVPETGDTQPPNCA